MFNAVALLFDDKLLGLVMGVAEDGRAPMHDILTAVALLTKLSTSHAAAATWVTTRGRSHEFARIRELCGSSPDCPGAHAAADHQQCY